MVIKQKQQRIKEYSSRKADLEQIRKADEDYKFEVWEKYLLRQRDLMKKLK
jgi:hypothetical protein